MDTNVSLIDSLVVTFVSMIIVFLVLILISFLISLLKKFSEGKKKGVIEMNQQIKVTDKEDIVVEENYEELAVVLAAAVAASLGLNIPDINIQSIRRIPQNTSPWSDMGRREQLRKL